MRNRSLSLSGRSTGVTRSVSRALLVAALTAPGTLAAQARTFDEGVLRVWIGTREVAREEFSVLRGRTADGGIGMRLLATAFYPPRRTAVTISPSVETNSDSLPRLAQFELTPATDVRIVAQFGPRILTVRRVQADGETFREYPGVARNWVVDDSVMALYALPPGTGSGPVRLVSPRDGARTDYQLTNRGTEEATVGGRPRPLLHLVLTAGADVRHLWYDGGGRLMKVEIPQRDLVAERETTGSIPGRLPPSLPLPGPARP
jgi:hypothetical protein